MQTKIKLWIGSKYLNCWEKPFTVYFNIYTVLYRIWRLVISQYVRSLLTKKCFGRLWVVQSIAMTLCSL